MINRLQLLRNVGQFDSVDEAANLPLTRLTLIFAENGRGKTTLAAILRSLATRDAVSINERRRLASVHPPHIVLDCDGGPPAAIFVGGAWNRSVPEITVFDDLFVHQNVCSGLVVDPVHRQNLHELILGAQGVALNRRMDEIVARIEVHNRDLREKEAAVPGDQRFGFTVDLFCGLAAHDNIEAEIVATERNLAAARAAIPVRDTLTFGRLALPEFDVASINALLARGLPDLDMASAAHVQEHIDTIGRGGETWVAEGVQRIRARDNVHPGDCPFCAQDLQGSPILGHYRAYFGAAYRELKESIAQLAAEVLRTHGEPFPSTFERDVRIAGERQQFWARFGDITGIELDTAAIGAAWRTARNAVTAALNTKSAAPLERLALSPDTEAAVAEYERWREYVEDLNNRLQEANVLIARIKQEAAAGNVQALESELNRLRAIRSRHSVEITPLCVQYLVAQAAKAATERERADTRLAIQEHRNRAFPACQLTINNYLQRFNAGFSLQDVAPADNRGGPICNYTVLVNDVPIAIAGGVVPAGEPSFRTALSSGDRNTLALAFFLASLEHDPDLANRIVIIDDPMTSLDHHRTLTTVQETRRLAGRVAQVVILSHDKRFLCQVWEGAERNQCSTFAVVRAANGSTIRAWDINADCVTEYDRHHEMLREYHRQNAGEARQIAETIRPVLEGFLRRACPEHFLPGEVLGDLRRKIRAGARSALSAGATQELDLVSEYANRFHHDTNEAYREEMVNDGELRGWVGRTLDFTRR